MSIWSTCVLTYLCIGAGSGLFAPRLFKKNGGRDHPSFKETLALAGGSFNVLCLLITIYLIVLWPTFITNYVKK